MQSAASVVQSSADQMAAAGAQASAAWDQTTAAVETFTAAERQSLTTVVESTAAVQKQAVALHEARGAAALLGEETGVRLNRHLRSVLATSETLGPILQAAFPVVAAIGFFEVIKQGAEKLSEMIADWVIYTEEMKKAYAAEIECNRQVIAAVDETRKLQAEHYSNTHTASQNAQHDLDNETAHQQQLRDQIKQRQKDIADLRAAQEQWQAKGGTPGYSGASSGQSAQANELKEQGWAREVTERTPNSSSPQPR